MPSPSIRLEDILLQTQRSPPRRPSPINSSPEILQKFTEILHSLQNVKEKLTTDTDLNKSYPMNGFDHSSSNQKIDWPMASSSHINPQENSRLYTNSTPTSVMAVTANQIPPVYYTTSYVPTMPPPPQKSYFTPYTPPGTNTQSMNYSQSVPYMQNQRPVSSMPVINNNFNSYGNG